MLSVVGMLDTNFEINKRNNDISLAVFYGYFRDIPFVTIYYIVSCTTTTIGNYAAYRIQKRDRGNTT